MKNQKALYSPTLASLPESLPAHRRPPAQQEPDVPRAYRLGKCETLYDLYSLLVNERCTAKDLQREIVVRMHELTRRDPTAIFGHKHLPQFQECQGMADACICCFDLIAVQKLHSYDLCNAIADCLFAAWPPDYLEYRTRCAGRTDQDLAPEEAVDCLDLRTWYAAVDTLHSQIACTEAAGLPPGEDQARMGALLLCTAGQALPCAE